MEILASLGLGLVVGFLLELVYKSWEHKQLVWPMFWNIQMYALTAVLLFLVRLTTWDKLLELLTVVLIPTLVEFITGSLYLKLTKKRLWDYTGEPLNFKGQIRFRFSIYWAVISITYYYLVLPKFVN